MKIKFIHFNNISFWRLRFIIIITVLLGPITGLALDPNKAVTQYSHDVWQTEDGLPHENIIAIIQTHDGYIWLGTPVGLVRFDGVRFTLFDKSNTANIKNNNITELFEDREGTLWIGSEGGLYQLNDGEFTLYTVKDGLSSNYIRSIYEDKEGSLWIGTYGGGVNRLRDGKFTFYTTQEGLSYDYVMSICEDREGNLWIATQGRGLNRLKDGKITTYTTQDGLSNDVVMSVYEDREGNLWIGTYGGGVNKLQDGKFTSYTTSEGLSHNSVISIVEDKDWNLWISTDGGGVSRLKDGNFSTFTTKDGLSNNTVRSIFEDREGSLWIGTYGGGLNRLKDGKFTTYTSKEGLSGELVMSVYKDMEGSLWLGTSVGGINRFKDGKFTAYTTKEGLSHKIVTSIYEDRNEILWIGTLGGGINRFKDGKFTIYARKEGLYNPYIRSLCTSKDGSLWIGTHGSGLFCMNDEKFINYTVEDGLSNGIIWSIYEDRKGFLWVGTNGGLNRFKDGEFTVYTTKEGLSDDIVLSIYEDREGNLWVGTHHGGLNLYRDGEFTTYTKQEGLYEESIFKILEDNKGNLWMSSIKGIFRVCKKELIDFADRKIKSINSYAYDKADGMKSNECTIGCPAGWKSSDGKLWFPTMKGLAMIDPENIKTNEQPPPVILEQIIIDNELIDLEENVPFSPGKKKFEFHYTGLSFLVPEKVKFKYKLDGFDKDWIDAGTRRTAYYTNIPPGDYTFKVIACNNDGVWNETGASFHFYLRSYFYQTKWFYGLCVLSLLSMGFMIYRLRVRQLTAQKKKLEIKVTERTKEIREQKEIIEQKKEQLQEKNEQITSSIRYAKRIQQAILPLDERIQSFLPEHFILYKPKDIVSGDFYWFNQINGKILLAVVDCTGHGVPGAFMSMIGNILLNEIVNELHVTDPALILENLHIGVRSALKQENGETNTDDGMDICLCVLDRKMKNVVFAGAKRPLYLVRGNNHGLEQSEIIEIKGDRKSIGGKQREKRRTFTRRKIKIQEEDEIYLMSDGFIDQSDTENRKYGTKRMKNFLESIAGLDVEKQKEALLQELVNHQGKEEQRDDITVVGVRV